MVVGVDRRPADRGRQPGARRRSPPRRSPCSARRRPLLRRSACSSPTPALTIGKVSIVAPIVATEGAVAALIAVALGDTIGARGRALLGRHRRRGRPVLARARPADVPAGDFDFVADALDDPRPRQALAPLRPDRPRPPTGDARSTRRRADAPLGRRRRSSSGSASSRRGKAAPLVPLAWVALAARLVGLVVVVVPLVLQRPASADPGRPAAGRHRRRRRDLRLDAVGVGLAREHRDRGGHGQPVRGDRRGRGLPVLASGWPPPGRRRRR